MSWPRIMVGKDLPHTSHLVADIRAAVSADEDFDYVVAPLFHPRSRRDALGISDKRQTPATRSDMVLKGDTWNSSVVGKMSPWLDLDASSPDVREASVQAFKQEAAWASHLGVTAVVAPILGDRCHNLARCINQIVQGQSYLHFWVRVPLVRATGAVDAFLLQAGDATKAASLSDLTSKITSRDTSSGSEATSSAPVSAGTVSVAPPKVPSASKPSQQATTAA